MNRIAILVIVLAVTFCSQVLSRPQDSAGNPINWCRNGLFPEDGSDFRIAKVIGQPNSRIYFFGDDDDCPNADPKKCRKRSYLVPGDKVIVSRTYDKWGCSWYQPRKGSETVGWLSSASLIIEEPDKNPSLKQWAGRWKYNYQSIDISIDKDGKSLSVTGEAIWRGLGDNVHTGSIEAKANPDKNELKLEQEECSLFLRMVGDYIVARDNSECGGANVRFNGVYQKQ
jgi:hypothetical protein